MTEISDADLCINVPSPFCGVGTDDLKIKVDGTRITLLENGCAVNKSAFEQMITDTSPQVNGQTVALQEAINKAAKILSDTQLPLISGLATDVNGMRAALELADTVGAITDNMNFTAAMRNFLVVHDTGWINTTLAEVKNRTDLLLVVGTDIEPLFPRFFEKYIWNSDALFCKDTSKRKVVYLGKTPSGSAAISPDGTAPTVLACEASDLPEVVAVLRGLVNENPILVSEVGGIEVSALRELADRLKKASYGVVTWAAAELNFSQAELTVQTVCEMVKDLNADTRCSGLPLGGKEGDQTAFQVSGWQTGYPSRVNFSDGYPAYDPYLNSTEQRLADGSADALVWVSSFNTDRTPPKTNIPTIVLGRSGMKFEKQPDVFIPVGTPGIDHAGHAYRNDNVVAIRLRKLRDAGLPSVSDVLTAIQQAL